MKTSTKKAFSLSEILVATFIWAIILWFIFVYTWDVIDDISRSKKSVKVITSFLDFSSKLNNYTWVYSSWSILIDNGSWTWSDVFLLKDPSLNTWLIFWTIDLSTYKIVLDTSVYKNTALWFRLLSNSDINAIEADYNQIFWLLFQKDKVFQDLKPQDLQIVSYNSWAIHSIDLFLNVNYQSWLNWELWENLPKSDLIKFNIDF